MSPERSEEVPRAHSEEMPRAHGAEVPGGASPAVSIVELEPVRVASIRSIVDPDDVPAFMADALGMIAAALHEARMQPAGPPFARYHSASPDGIDVEAGFPVAEPFIGGGVVHPGELTAGPAAMATHVGPFDGLEAAWRALRATVDRLDRRRADDPWEVYVVGPGSGVEEADWRTELIWPLAPEEAGEAAAVPPPGEGRAPA